MEICVCHCLIMMTASFDGWACFGHWTGAHAVNVAAWSPSFPRKTARYWPAAIFFFFFERQTGRKQTAKFFNGYTNRRPSDKSDVMYKVQSGWDQAATGEGKEIDWTVGRARWTHPNRTAGRWLVSVLPWIG